MKVGGQGLQEDSPTLVGQEPEERLELFTLEAKALELLL